MRDLALHDVDRSNIARVITEIISIENQVYEPARRDSQTTLAGVACSERSIGAVCTSNGKIVGFSFAARLESFLHINGCREDCQSGRNTTLYSADIAVAESHRRQHIGLLLKIHQIYRAKLSGHSFISSRNRESLAVEMLRINECVGAKIAARIGNAYRDQSASREALYMKLQVDHVSIEQLVAQLQPAAATAFDGYIRGQRLTERKI